MQKDLTEVKIFQNVLQGLLYFWNTLYVRKHLIRLFNRTIAFCYTL